ncbi:uncharacterized protein LOC109946248 isoform X1 [Prunus persica]|uniref:uncharacterized protein LOC109946248 isoform X1 n=1 Tax=Prunus persica TaxID=3760 RepID=UPI0009AB49E6|nr:uncharacterized protein LOC109946248 isoform X1 [Prunus persica]XP_020425415.1 uncharacterized protein LOC109946248 isoform X1 [Prunus persica]XP_020425416.1 uncharacterized protein LOC109946248 isoform X1 [Prunus persica]XP_020425417.1 uncharacterized protein LOC109946248 isoform X1 [Prunus persica]
MLLDICAFCVFRSFQTCFQKTAHLCHGIRNTITLVKLLNYTMKSFSVKTKILHCLLEGTAASHVENIGDEEKDANKNSNDGSSAGKGSSKWVKVNEKRALHDVLKEPKFVIRGIPVFFVVSKRSSFYKEFKAGKWAPPP